MRVLITGATGLVGSEVLRSFPDEHEWIALARRVPQDGPGGIRWIQHDLVRRIDRARLPTRVDAVIHLAQSPRHREFPEGAPDVFAVTVRATFELLEYARSAGADRFLLASSGGVYGEADRGREQDPTAPPLSFYLASKRAAEQLVDAYREVLRPVILRPFFVYGPGREGRLVRSLADKVLAGREITIHGDPGMRTTPLYVGDAARAVAAALERDVRGAIDLAGEDAVTLTELAELIAEIAGREARITHANARPGDLVGDSKRMREELGVTPTPLREGLLALVRGAHP